jgi:hypothetical protein
MKKYYLCNKVTKDVLYIGPLPEVWNTISGLNDLDENALTDLSWSGPHNKDYGFFTEESALALGINPSIVKDVKLKDIENEWFRVREIRDGLIRQVRWRLERHDDQVTLGIQPTESKVHILEYIQKLRDITKQPDPFNIDWPAYP